MQGSITEEHGGAFRRAAAMLVAAVLGLGASVVSALALVPRVQLVEVVTVIASAAGGGAALAVALVQFRQARAAARHGRGRAFRPDAE
jgi:hypothetical protein